MIEFDCIVKDPMGLHARPAGALVRAAKQYRSRVTLSANGKECDATRLMALMALCVKSGTKIGVRVEGEDEAECAEGLRRFFAEEL